MAPRDSHDTGSEDVRQDDPSRDGTESPLTEVVTARGHEHVSATHESTFELTTDDWLTPAGDCIVGVEADRAPAAFDPAFVDACRDSGAKITARLAVGDHVDTVVGRGHPDLAFENDRSLVCRTSTYVDDRTVMVEADRAAAHLDRQLIGSLSSDAAMTLTLTVE